MDKYILSRALLKCYIIISKFTDKGEEYVHATLNPKIIEYVTGSTIEIRDITCTDKVHTIFDLKNEKILEYEISNISQISYPGLPFEISPNYIINPNFGDRINIDEILIHQAKELDILKHLKTYQKDSLPENNFIPSSLLLNIKLINVANSLKDTFIKDNKDAIDKDNMCKDICNQHLPSIEFLDKHYLEFIFSKNVDKGSAAINYKYLTQLQKLLTVLKENNLELDNLDEPNSRNLEKYKELWRTLIEKNCDALIKELTEDTDKFKEEFPELSSEQEEVKFVIDTLKNTSKGIDYSIFATPRELFSFWPPILYPSPEFVLDTVYLKK